MSTRPQNCSITFRYILGVILNFSDEEKCNGGSFNVSGIIDGKMRTSGLHDLESLRSTELHDFKMINLPANIEIIEEQSEIK